MMIEQAPIVDKEQFSALIVAHQKLIYKVCHMYADLPEDVEDLFQEIVLNLWRAYPSFENRSQVGTWLYRVALNTAITRLRKVKRRDGNESDIDWSTLRAENSTYDQELQTLYDAIKQLNKVEKALVVLYLEDRSYREMAEIMGISENYVGVQLNRIKKKLKQLSGGGSHGS